MRSSLSGKLLLLLLLLFFNLLISNPSENPMQDFSSFIHLFAPKNRSLLTPWHIPDFLFYVIKIWILRSGFIIIIILTR